MKLFNDIISGGHQTEEVPGIMSYTGTFLVKRGYNCVFKNQFQGPMVELDGILKSERDQCFLKPAIDTLSSFRNICLPSPKY